MIPDILPRLDEAITALATGTPPSTNLLRSARQEIDRLREQMGAQWGGYSCNGIDLRGNPASIKAAIAAFHAQEIEPQLRAAVVDARAREQAARTELAAVTAENERFRRATQAFGGVMAEGVTPP